MDNTSVTSALEEIGDILELKAEDSFKINAYRRAAESIENLSENVEDIANQGKLDEIPGIGKSIAEKINEFLKTNRIKYLEDLRKKVPSGLVAMLQVAGLGPKTIIKLNKEFKIKNIDDLKKLLKTHKISKLKGFGLKSEENIEKGIEQFKRNQERYALGKIYPLACDIVEKLERASGVDKVSLAGSIRRMQETIGDIDILCTSKKPEKAIEVFVSLPQVKEIQEKGTTKAVVILKNDIEADLRVVKPESFGTALHYFTGSKAHNIKIRTMGEKKGLKINEYGVYKTNKHRGKRIEDRVGGKTEEEIFKAVGLPYIEPEIRQDMGEIEAAEKDKLPRLIQLCDIQGDLHIHTTYSEGKNTIEEMAKAAIKMGYKYILISDHTKKIGITHGMDEKKILKQIKEIDKINAKFQSSNIKFKVLKGVECDINSDGSLDLPDKILGKLDIVIAAIHSKFNMDQTQRLIKACENPHVDIIGHPTGRRLGFRDPYKVDLEKLMNVCKKTKTILELNAAWERLDLNAQNCRKAKEKGLKISIGTDSHSINSLSMMQFGVATARRGWLEKDDIINTQANYQLLGQLN